MAKKEREDIDYIFKNINKKKWFKFKSILASKGVTIRQHFLNNIDLTITTDRVEQNKNR